MLDLYKNPFKTWKDYKLQEVLIDSNIWNEFEEVFSLSFINKWDKLKIKKVKKFYPSLKPKFKKFKGENYKEFEHAIQAYLLEKPALLEYFFQEIMICFAEAWVSNEGTGARPDIILGQQSHRGEPRHYLIIELKRPNILIENKGKISSPIGTAILQTFNRQSFSDDCGFFQKIRAYKRDIENRKIDGIHKERRSCANDKINGCNILPENSKIDFIWKDYLILASSQVFRDPERAIPVNGYKTKKSNKKKPNRESNVMISFKQSLPAMLHSYCDLRRPVMRDIIAMDPENFDKWIETKSEWIRSATKKFTKNHNNVKQYNPYR